MPVMTCRDSGSVRAKSKLSVCLNCTNETTSCNKLQVHATKLNKRTTTCSYRQQTLTTGQQAPCCRKLYQFQISGLSLCSGMGSSSSSLDNIPNSRELMQETGFSYSHLLRLYERFEFLDKGKRGHLRPQDFEALKELVMNPIGDRIIGAFFSPGEETVDFPAFVRVLAHFRPTEKKRIRAGTKPEPINSCTGKLKFAFQLYDQDRDGKISRAELLQVLRAMLGMQVTEEQLESIAERAIQEADLDKDDAISFDEFRKSLEKVNIDHKMSIRFLR